MLLGGIYVPQKNFQIEYKKWMFLTTNASIESVNQTKL